MLTFALFSINSFAASYLPVLAVCIRHVQPSRSRALISAPAFNSFWMIFMSTSSFPSGLQTYRRFVFWTSCFFLSSWSSRGLAPYFSKRSSMSEKPFSEALYSGEFPSLSWTSGRALFSSNSLVASYLCLLVRNTSRTYQTRLEYPIVAKDCFSRFYWRH